MFKRSIIASGLCWLALASGALGAEPAALQTGTAFRRELEGATDIVWKDQRTLREAIASLSNAKRIAMLLDRRVDPEQLVSLEVAEVTLEQALRQLASRHMLGIAIFDSTVYLGPETVTQRLATVAAIQHDKSQVSGHRNKLKSLAALDSATLSTPRELLEDWATTSGVKLYDAEKIPHDLWPALRYPQQSAASRASLILAGFDLAIEFSPAGTAARVIDMPKQATLTRSYPASDNAQNRAAQIEKQFPRVEVAATTSQLTITGSYEDHDAIGRLLRGETVRRTEVGPSEKRYTLNVENQPLGAVARALAAQAKLEIEFDDALQEKLGQRISFQVRDATLEELLQALVAPAGLGFVILDNKVKIFPKK